MSNINGEGIFCGMSHSSWIIILIVFLADSMPGRSVSIVYFISAWSPWLQLDISNRCTGWPSGSTIEGVGNADWFSLKFLFVRVFDRRGIVVNTGRERRLGWGGRCTDRNKQIAKNRWGQGGELEWVSQVRVDGLWIDQRQIGPHKEFSSIVLEETRGKFQVSRAQWNTSCDRAYIWQ